MARYAALSGSYGNAEVKQSLINPELADRVVGIVKSDQDGTLDIEQSSDGTNWDWKDTLTIVAGTAQKFSFEVFAPYVRASYTNSATPATVRCSVRLSSAGGRA